MHSVLARFDFSRPPPYVKINRGQRVRSWSHTFRFRKRGANSKIEHKMNQSSDLKWTSITRGPPYSGLDWGEPRYTFILSGSRAGKSRSVQESKWWWSEKLPCHNIFQLNRSARMSAPTPAAPTTRSSASTGWRRRRRSRTPISQCQKRWGMLGIVVSVW